jgi:hypothetical protein
VKQGTDVPRDIRINQRGCSANVRGDLLTGKAQQLGDQARVAEIAEVRRPVAAYAADGQGRRTIILVTGAEAGG